jgi:hypothetical protein
VFKVDAIDQQSVRSLARGCAYVISTLNIHKVNANDVLAAETAMMLREHIAESYGLPRWMVGMGGSGGAIQQMLIAQNYRASSTESCLMRRFRMSSVQRWPSPIAGYSMHSSPMPPAPATRSATPCAKRSKATRKELCKLERGQRR